MIKKKARETKGQHGDQLKIESREGNFLGLSKSEFIYPYKLNFHA